MSDEPNRSNVIPLNARTTAVGSSAGVDPNGNIDPNTSVREALDEAAAFLTLAMDELRKASNAVDAKAQRGAYNNDVEDPIAYAADLTYRIDDATERLRTAGIRIVATQTLISPAVPPDLVV
jgi:hypothetical protein